MLSSDRLRTTNADDHDETDLWERLRSEANRRSVAPAAPSEPPGQYDDYQAAFEGELTEDYAGDSDLPPSPYEGAQRFVRSSYPPPSESYAQAQQEYSETAQLEHYSEESYEQQQYDDGYAQPDYQAQDYQAQEEEAQQYAAQQYDLQRFSQSPAQPQQYVQPYGEQPAHSPSGTYGQQYASQQPAAYGHVTPALGASAQPQQWGYASSVESTMADEAGKSSGWTKVLAALVVIGAIGAAGYQFVLVPRKQAARAAELADLQQRQAALIEQQEKENAAAAAEAEAVQKRANEEALKRADEAAAAAAGEQQAVAAVTPAKAKGHHSSSSNDEDSSAADERERKRQERHERRAARKAEKEASRSAKSDSSSTSASSSKPSKASKKVSSSVDEESSDDPLLGL